MNTLSFVASLLSHSNERESEGEILLHFMYHVGRDNERKTKQTPKQMKVDGGLGGVLGCDVSTRRRTEL